MIKVELGMAHALGLGYFPKHGVKSEFVVPSTEALKHTAEFSDEWQLVYSHDKRVQTAAHQVRA